MTNGEFKKTLKRGGSACLSLVTRHLSLFFCLGFLAFASGFAFSAEEELPSGVRALYDQALQDLQSHRPAEAARKFQQVVDSFPANRLTPAALWKLGQVQESGLNDPSAAIPTYHRLVKEFPSSGYSRPAEARLKALEKFEGPERQALFAYQNLLRKEPEIPPEEFVAELTRLLRAFPDSEEKAQVWYSLGLAHLRAGSSSQAIETLQDLKIHFPQSTWSYMGQEKIGEIFFNHGDFLQAIAEFEKLQGLKNPFEIPTFSEHVAIARSHYHRQRLLYVLLVVGGVLLLLMLLRLPWRHVRREMLLAGWKEAVLLSIMAGSAWLLSEGMVPRVRVTLLFSGLLLLIFSLVNAVYIQAAPLKPLERKLHPWLSLLLAGCLIYLVAYTYDLLPAYEELFTQLFQKTPGLPSPDNL